MPRLAGLDAPGFLHPVMGRGIEKRKIFFDDEKSNPAHLLLEFNYEAIP
jgi:hypothetical protein